MPGQQRRTLSRNRLQQIQVERSIRRPEALQPPAAALLRRLRGLACAIVAIALLASPRVTFANGADLPPEIVLQGFARQEGSRIHLVVRIPLLLFSTFEFPKRGPGYLDLARMDDKLHLAAVATGQQIAFAEDGVPLAAGIAKARVSALSDRSFQSYDAAVAHLQGPPLPSDTDLFWNQGFVDVQLEYQTRSETPRLSLRVNVAPELGRRLKLRLQFVPADGSVRAFELPGGTGWVPLDPRWYEVAWLFVMEGFVGAFAIDRFAFLLCLIAPFQRFRSLLAVVMILTAMQAVTLLGVAEGRVIAAHWLPAIVASTLSATILLLAIGNLAAPSLRRRWFIAAVIGALGGFGVGQFLGDLGQFAGRHPFVSAASFNVGIALGEAATLAIAFFALRLLFARVLGPPLGVIVLSVVLGLLAWNGTMDNSHELVHELGHAVSEGFSAASPMLLWLLPAFVVGSLALFLPRRFGGMPIRTLRDALLGRDPDR